MEVTLTKSARKALKRLDTQIASRILAKIEAYAEDPASQAANVRTLKGRNRLRLRVGDYRVIFSVDGDVIEVMTVYLIGHRKDVYDGI